MPKGVYDRTKKEKVEKVEEPIYAEGQTKEEVLPVVLKQLEPLGPGQAYFEAPDGAILIGEETTDRMWYRAGNGGKGLWINKRR